MPYICVYRGTNSTDAYLVRHFLTGNDVDSQVRGDLVGLRGKIPMGDAWPTVWVESRDRARAEALIRQFNGPRLVHPQWSCTECSEVNGATFEWCWNCQTERPATADPAESAR